MPKRTTKVRREELWCCTVRSKVARRGPRTEMRGGFQAFGCAYRRLLSSLCPCISRLMKVSWRGPMDTITELMSLLGCTNAAWIVGADWNHSLEELHDLQLDRACQGDFVVPEGPTISTGSRIDYFLVSKSLVNKSRAAVHHTVPWKPHYAVMRSLDLRPEVLSLPSLERFGRIPCCHGPRLPWSAFQKASSKCRSGHISVIVTMSSTTCSRSSSPSLKPGCCPRSPTLLTLG